MNEPIWRSIIDDGRSDDPKDGGTEQEKVKAEPDVEEQKRIIAEKLARKRAARLEAERKRIRKNRIIAACALVGVVLMAVVVVKAAKSSPEQPQTASSAVSAEAQAKQPGKNPDSSSQTSRADPEPEHKVEQTNGMTFVDDILIVNKTYSLPSDYAPGVSEVAVNAFNKMSEAAANDGVSLWINSGYRSYEEQEELYNGYVAERGTEEADNVSSRPGHSEHQTGLAFDVNDTSFGFEDTEASDWLKEHCCEYGFIIRFPEGKEASTGYEYEPWHIRYLGKKIATEVTESGLSLEEYLGITSEYPDESTGEDSSETQA